MKDLKFYRDNLYDIDRQIVNLLEKRLDIVKDIGKYKKTQKLPTTDKNREQTLITSLEKQISPEYTHTVKPIYNEIFNQSKNIIDQVKEEFSYGLIGEHLGHSKSPEIHRLLGDYDYKLKAISKEQVERFFTTKDFKGINVTIPYKIEAIKYLDYIDPIAKNIGSVNTVVNKNNRLYGYNTDYSGFQYMLDYYKINLQNKKVLILGSGGSSKMIQQYCKINNVKDYKVISRSGPDNYKNINKYSDYEIIINSTPVGMYPDNLQSPISLEIFTQLEGVVDIIYNPLETRLILESKKLGVKTATGLIMLVAQAYYAGEYFLDREFNEDVIVEIYHTMKKEMENITFVGMPSSGKTTMGKLIGEKLNRPFKDIDQLIIERTGLTIPEIFENYGEEYFRDIESTLLEEVTKDTGQVISTGGGSPLREKNRLMIEQNSLVIYLNRKLEHLETEGRPLSKDQKALEKIYQDRSKIYEEISDIKINVTENIDETVNLIIQGLKNEPTSH